MFGCGGAAGEGVVFVPSPRVCGERATQNCSEEGWVRGPLCLRFEAFSAGGRLLAQPPAAEKKTVWPLDPKIVGELGPLRVFLNPNGCTGLEPAQARKGVEDGTF